MRFPDRQEIARVLRSELPKFARFLMDWTIPEACVAEERRFGVKAYHHPELLAESRSRGIGVQLELLDGYLRSFREANPKRDLWFGTSVSLYSEMALMYPDIMRVQKVTQIGMFLAKLEKNGYNVRKVPDRLVQHWIVGVDLEASNVKNMTEAEALELKAERKKQNADQ